MKITLVLIYYVLLCMIISVLLFNSLIYLVRLHQFGCERSSMKSWGKIYFIYYSLNESVKRRMERMKKKNKKIHTPTDSIYCIYMHDHADKVNGSFRTGVFERPLGAPLNCNLWRLMAIRYEIIAGLLFLCLLLDGLFFFFSTVEWCNCHFWSI